MAVHKPSDYAHAYGEPCPSHWGRAVPGAAGADAPDEADAEAVAGGAVGAGNATGAGNSPGAAVTPGELATFRLLYESPRICVFETREGHLSAVDTSRLA